jgi:hypothetical protein
LILGRIAGIDENHLFRLIGANDRDDIIGKFQRN